MNKSLAPSNSRVLRRLLSLVLPALLGVTAVAQTQSAQPSRFLLVFETSPVLKKNLVTMQQTIAQWCASNLHGELRSDDDVAVWTVDQELHSGAFPMTSWTPDEASVYANSLDDFLGHQRYNRHASLTALQPLLNRVVKGSERITVLIFCDSQSHLMGTPYDDGANEILTNAASRLNGSKEIYIIVLRAYHGEYIGCSVNRAGSLNLPKFPEEPKSQSPAVTSVKIPPASPAPAPASMTTTVAGMQVTAASGPAVSPVPALIIVGTHASTNMSAYTQSPPPRPQPAPMVTPETGTAPAPAPSAYYPPASSQPAQPQPETQPAAPVINMSTPPPSPAPAPTPTLAAPAPAPQPTTMAAAPVQSTASAPNLIAPASTPSTTPASGPPPTLAAGTANPQSDSSLTWLWGIGAGALVVAGIIILSIMMRARQPRGSLISSSMQDDQRFPPKT